MATGAPGQARIVLTGEDATGAAFAAVSRRFVGLKDDALAVKGQLAGVAATIGAVFAALAVKGRIELLDQLDKLQEKTGLTSEQLSILRYQGELANVPIEDLAKGANTLAKAMAAAAGGNEKANATFEAMGLKVRDGNGALKSFDVILGEISDKFKSYNDGPEKAALATRLFKDQGAAMIPLLNQGSEGLAKQAREARELGILFGGDLTRNAAEFNDNLTRLKLTSEAAAIAIGSQLLPKLNELLTTYLEAKNKGLIGSVLQDAGKGVFGFGRLSGDVQADIKNLTREREGILKDIEFLQRKGLPIRDRQNDLADVGDLLQFSRIKQRNKALQDLGDTGDALSRKLAVRKTDAPIADSGGADKAEAILKKQLEGQLKAIKDFAELQKVGIEFSNDQAKAAYEAGFLSVQELFERQRQARDADYKNATDELDATIATQQEFARKALKPEDRIGAENAIADAQSRRIKASLQYENATAAAYETERVATQRVKDAYDALGASVLDLEGKTLEAAKARIRTQAIAEAIAVGQTPGGDQALVQKKESLLKLDAELADVQKRYAILVAASGDAEALLALKAQESGATERDTLIALGVERQKALEQLRELADAAQRLADERGTPEAVAAARALALAFQRATAEADPLLQKTRELGKEMGDAIGSAADDAILHWQGFMSLLNAVGMQILQITLRSQVTKPLGDYLGNLIGGNGQASGGGGFLGSIFPGLFGAASGSPGGGFDSDAALMSFVSGMRANGGPVNAGDAYVVGERGRELFVPDVSGQIVPNSRMGGGMTFAPTINITGPVNQRTLDQVRQESFAGAQRAMRRNG